MIGWKTSSFQMVPYMCEICVILF
uniref:Uncharacterized protein n=1 Tax=Rhizophora mucronata TaxID=61149 RepID=A0A2P2NQ71_RHIMU